MDLPTPPGSLVLLESQTGSGKTEAALWRFAQLLKAGACDGLYFALPTRAAAVQLHGRVDRAMRALLGDNAPLTVLALPGYLRAGEMQGRKLSRFETLWDDEQQAPRAWAAEHPKRFLAATVAVGSVDQALLSMLRVKHAAMRGALLSRLLLVIDEVHASDFYMRALLAALLKRHRAAGGHALLMSATLGAGFRAQLFGEEAPTLEAAVAAPYPLITWCGTGEAAQTRAPEAASQQKAVQVESLPLADEAATIVEQALAAARQGARVLILRNTVGDAVATQQALEALAWEGSPLLLRCGELPALCHSRFSPEDRRALDGALEQAFRPKQRGASGVVAVTTQTAEQSLDIDADWLMTDLCPMDVLLQRIGRLHRHADRARPAGFTQARASILMTPQPDWAGWAAALNGAGSRGPHGWGTVYEDLRVLRLTAELIDQRPHWNIPADNRLLVESAMHQQALDQLQARAPDMAEVDRFIAGQNYTDSGMARIALLKVDKPLMDDDAQALPTQNRAATRLGSDDRMALFAEPHPMSPLANPVAQLRLPESLVRGCQFQAEENPRVIQQDDAGFAFAWGGKTFLYDRYGVRRA
ncbi:putative CRISPR-associated helicase Cas3 [Magnetofaba australis IT-1]|uniref:Putative CRISPR-associated helicase Cas3 n=1 Tax=Magnetofaba australis IT-1 TaxID=1434232 RepID=A0A1Y2K1Y1_9PROT|nr:putative CRISPR-associated helicase Cas3 [Magnetofaba australis IT-1]